MKTKKNILTIFIVLFIYIGVNLFIHKTLWHEFFSDSSKSGAVYGEVQAVEWSEEQLYQNIKSGKNPFSQVKGLFYPFGTNLLSADAGNGFFFLFLRPFFSVHQSMVLLVLIQIILANLGMFLLLRTFGISDAISFLIGLAYGYMTFLMLRLGHLTYFSVYVFPWFYYCFLQIIKDNNKIWQKLFFSFTTALVFTLALYHNLYYFIMLCLASFLLLVYVLIFQRKIVVKTLMKNWHWFSLTAVFILIFSSPWLATFYDTYRFEGLPRTEGWGGAIQFSSDLFGYLIPSSYGYFFGKYAEAFSYKFTFASGIFENFTYPGLIIILSYLGGLILLIKKTLKKKNLIVVAPYLFAGICFWVLTLGPFLHVFGKWGVILDEGIRVIVPLPYIILHKIPFLSNLRSPGRLIVGFIFFSYILSAYIINFFIKKKSRFFKTIFIIGLFLLFIIDQYFQYSSASSQFYPNKIYKKINEDKNTSTVMESPSVIRDGFTYFGDEGGFNFFVGQLVYKKPVLAGYFGRVPIFKRDYYINNPLLGYFGRLMDENIKNNGGFNKSDLQAWQKLNINKAKDALNFLDVSYFILDNEKTYSASISADLANLDFKKIMDEKNFSLWKRDIEQKEFLKVNIGKNDEMYLGMGWNDKERDGRWAWKRSSVMFKVINPKKFILNFQAKTYHKAMPVDIYVDKKKIASVTIPLENKEFTIPVNFVLDRGIHTIHFLFRNAYRPSEIFDSPDNRQLSAKFINIYLQPLR
ncbi:hypothetical protein COY87_05065 [Candidatus Roizmanbacteria bacterium CG_4_10_14_0_8_um_filter_33_9]|uniref:Glycosyltransferase RgtA/B/C/D-like domain-containing protein n=1 Tax=Candidatus Roizmanbacteria bacterium CG_4_10_14_0_8_um_filter_33_9 TaxID=1974826 RepID=A0A2M7QIF5_9BACT|nr:MAG: hypothetical protein COY87_05065 [Candidatus Roizmanbacteria bacterium CG_4_10_14_0_8_um_filter_33_9]